MKQLLVPIALALVFLTGCQPQEANQAEQDSIDQSEAVTRSDLSRETDEMQGHEHDHDNDHGHNHGHGHDEPVQPPQAGDELSLLTAGNRAFALAAFQQLLAEDAADENILISPHSILAALAMVYAGAEGVTREEMRATLRFTLDDTALHAAFQTLDSALAERSAVNRDDDASGFELNIVNQLWGHDSYDFVPTYLELIETHYGAGVDRVDFAADADAARQAINDWVEAQTRERIQDLLPDGVLDEDTRLVLVNAIYFLASWQDAFEPEQTRDQPFRPLEGSPAAVPMMQRTAHFPTYLGEDTVAVALPYLGEQVALLAMMPADESADFLQWQEGLDPARFDRVVAGLDSRRVDLDFPRFSAEGGFRLADLLRSMGMESAFSRNQANFERMTGVGPGVLGQSLYIDEVFHKTFIELDEAGTEAAAATAVVMMRVTSMPVEDDPVSIRFDRPFVYAIYDRPTGSILFLGRQAAIAPD